MSCSARLDCPWSVRSPRHRLLRLEVRQNLPNDRRIPGYTRTRRPGSEQRLEFCVVGQEVPLSHLEQGRYYRWRAAARVTGAMAHYRTRAPKGVFRYASHAEMEADRQRWAG